MRRITQADLEAIVSRINRMTNSPLESWTKDKAGKFKANIGNYHLDWAYGGVSLDRMQSEGGGVTDVLQCGHVTKRELYNMLHSFVAGIETSEKSAS